MSQARFIEDFLSVTDPRNPVEVSMSTQLGDLPERDSLAASGVIIVFDMEYGKTTTGEDLTKAHTVGGLYQMLGLRPWSPPR